MRQGIARSRAGGDAPSPKYYQWAVEGHHLSIQVSFAVIDQLEADIMKGFWSVPKRGAEVGGVLFGRIETLSEASSVVYIEDYEPVPCEYRRGPSYVLSENDRRRLERTLRKGSEERRIVGYYRSHTRLGLYLDQDDNSIIQSYFANPNYVFLLVRPHASKTSVGGFFVWEEGVIHRQSTYLEFPFSTSEITKRNAGQQETEVQVSPPAAETAVSTERAVPAGAPPPVPAKSAVSPVAATAKPFDWGRVMRPFERAGTALKWRLLTRVAAAVVIVAAAEYGVVQLLARRTPPPGYLPALRIERNGAYLQVNWNHSAPSILNAERALLVITDGHYRKELNLDAAQLRNGSIAYSPSSSDVSFRLDVVDGRSTVSESLRVVEAVRPVTPVAANRPVLAVRPAQPSPVQAPAVQLPQPRGMAAGPRPPAKMQARMRRRAYYDDGL